MSKYEILVFLGSILAFAVGTLVPILKALLKVNSTIQRNTDTIKSLQDTMDDFTNNNKKEHDHFFSSINTLEKDVAILKEKHRKD